jgi:hypothetical protein
MDPHRSHTKKTKQAFFTKKTKLYYSQSKINLCCNILYCIFILCLLLNFIQANHFSHSNNQYFINLSFCSNGIFENIFTVEGTYCFLACCPPALMSLRFTPYFQHILFLFAVALS